MQDQAPLETSTNTELEGTCSMTRTGLESVIPDNTRFSINMHYQSEATGEFGTLRVNKSMTVEQILDQYARLFPIECQLFIDSIKLANQNLYRPGGMSKEGVMMAIGRIPKIVLIALEFINPDFFMMDSRQGMANFRRFVRAYPKFAIGDHSRKHTLGAIVK